MNIEETAKVLAKIRLIDNRTVGEGVVLAWHDVIGELDFEDAIAAVDECRRYLKTYLLRAHVIEEAADQRSIRERENGSCMICGAVHRKDRRYAVLCAACEVDPRVEDRVRALALKDCRTYITGAISSEEQQAVYDAQSDHWRRRALGE
jgi:hypothetical protein